MGNVFADQNNTNKSSQRATNSNEQLDSSQQYTNLNLVEKLANAKAASAVEEEMPNPAVATLTKTPEIKCNDIANELNRIQEEIHEFNGQKNDKDFLKLDEYLTRCLLKLDEIDRTDEFVNQQRKTLISFTHELAEYLETKCQTALVPLEKAISNSLDTNSNDEK